MHELTSPQPFESLRLAGRKVRRPDPTLATADHNVPTDGSKVAAQIADHLSRVQVQTLENNCAELGVPVHSIGSARQGTVHVIGPEHAYPNDINTRNAQLAAVQINGNPSTQSATTPPKPTT